MHTTNSSMLTRMGDRAWAHTRILDDAYAPSCPDVELVEAVRREPLEEAALDLLVRRHWRALYARCRVLTGDAQTARDVAHDVWCRVLQSRHRIDPQGNLAGYLATIATNLWRDRSRAARRAGPLAEARLASLDALRRSEHGDDGTLADVLPDPQSLDGEERRQLGIDIDRALATLSPRDRDVLLARFVDDESAADIGRRYGRTEQTITSWLREAARQVRVRLTAPGGAVPQPR